jgi:hypothetical protein
VLVVTCPTTRKDFSTGILTDTDSLALTPLDLTFVLSALSQGAFLVAEGRKTRSGIAAERMG